MSSSTEVLITGPSTLPTDTVRLARHLQWTAGMFSLAFVRWNHPGQEDAVLPSIQAACDLPIRIVSVAEVPVEDVLAVCSAAAGGEGNPLFVFGMHRHFPDFLHTRDDVIPPILTVLNLQRELFLRQIGCPLVLWLPEQALEMIARNAPDFWSWRSGVFEFDLPREVWLDAGRELRLNYDDELNVTNDEVPYRIAERLGVWQDLTKSGAIPLRESKSAADVATDLFHLYTRDGDVSLADDWFSNAVEQYQRIQKDLNSTALTSASAARGEGRLWWRNQRGNRNDQLQRAIACFEAALRVYTEDRFPHQWAMTQDNLGTVYSDLPTGDRGENQRRAIACYEAALRVYNVDRLPHQWAMTQNNLALVYAEFPTGDRGENLRRAIASYEAALQVWTEDRFPNHWATTQNNLGTVYSDLPTGDRAENLRRAIACYKSALRVHTEDGFPHNWAITQNNLGTVYSDLPTGDRAENLRQSIVCYEAALRVWTEDRFQHNWATIQNNLGNVYGYLPTGDRAENLRRAIACYESALRVYTEDRFSHKWAMTQNNLGNVYSNLPTGDRAENLRWAIACYESALRVYTEDRFPHQWAMTQNNLGTVYANLPMGDRGENLRRAIACYEAALRVRTEDRFPQDWAKTQFNSGLALRDLAAETADKSHLANALTAFEAAAQGYRTVGLVSNAEQAERQAQQVRAQLA